MAGASPATLWSDLVRISPWEDVVGQDVLAVRVLVTSDDSRVCSPCRRTGRDGLGRQLWGR